VFFFIIPFLQEQIEKLKNEIDEKKSHIRVLEQRMAQSLETTEDPAIRTEMSQVILVKWLHDKPGGLILSLIGWCQLHKD
jgi:hypothetical protein